MLTTYGCAGTILSILSRRNINLNMNNLIVGIVLTGKYRRGLMLRTRGIVVRALCAHAYSMALTQPGQ